MNYRSKWYQFWLPKFHSITSGNHVWDDTTDQAIRAKGYRYVCGKCGLLK